MFGFFARLLLGGRRAQTVFNVRPGRIVLITNERLIFVGENRLINTGQPERVIFMDVGDRLVKIEESERLITVDTEQRLIEINKEERLVKAE